MSLFFFLQIAGISIFQRDILSHSNFSQLNYNNRHLAVDMFCPEFYHSLLDFNSATIFLPWAICFGLFIETPKYVKRQVEVKISSFTGWTPTVTCASCNTTQSKCSAVKFSVLYWAEIPTRETLLFNLQQSLHIVTAGDLLCVIHDEGRIGYAKIREKSLEGDKLQDFFYSVEFLLYSCITLKTITYWACNSRAMHPCHVMERCYPEESLERLADDVGWLK